MPQKLSLKWNEFQSNITKNFNLLREEEFLQDVTLVTDDNELIHANKFMLSACSNYFKEIFKNNSKHLHPLICLTGISHEDLKSLLEYVHNGEVSILEGNLDRFLELAKRLRIEGLFQDRFQQETKIIESFKHEPQDFNQEEVNSEIFCPDNLQMETGKAFDEDAALEEIVSTGELHKETLGEQQTVQDKLKEIKQYCQRVDVDLYKCVLCGKSSNRPRNIRRHIETHFDGLLEFPCKKCGHIFHTRKSLDNHVQNKCGKVQI